MEKFGEEFNYHLVDWDTVCFAYCRSGCGVKRLEIFWESCFGDDVCLSNLDGGFHPPSIGNVCGDELLRRFSISYEGFMERNL